MSDNGTFISIENLVDDKWRNGNTRALFICRGSTREGLGHVTRSLSVIKQILRDIPHVRMIILGDEFAAELVKNVGIGIEVCKEDFEVNALIEAFKPNITFFDLNKLDYSVFQTAARISFTAALSPLFEYMNEVDVAFNRTKYFKADITLPEEKRRFGLQYAIIPENCLQISEKVYVENLTRKVFSIGVSMGGTDSANKTLQVLEAIKVLKQPTIIWCLLGEGYSHSFEDLVAKAKENGRHEIILAKTVHSMWSILQNCNVAVLAGGVTTYESVYAGMPSINLFETESDYFLIKELEERGCSLNAGLIKNGGIERLKDILNLLSVERWRLLNMHRKAKKVLDKYGVNRVIDETVTLYNREKMLHILNSLASVESSPDEEPKRPLPPAIELDAVLQTSVV